MPRCKHCNGFVSNDFVRDFADADGRIHACPNYTANASIAGTAIERRSGS